MLKILAPLAPLAPRLRALAIAAGLLAASAGSHAAVIYSLSSFGDALIRFDSANPGAVTTIGAISGATTHLDGMDFRPADGQLYGYNQATSGVYRIDVATGATVLVSTTTTASGSDILGIDFNPVPDRLRLVNAGGQNLRINVATGATLVDGTLAYAAADANAGAQPFIVDAAYTNHDRDPATGTTLYYIDSELDILVSTAAPNAGILNTVGLLGVDVDAQTGFDIYTEAGFNIAYASFRVGGRQGLYTIDLGTGAASLIGEIAAANLFGLAVAPVPEPGPVALLGAAGLVALARRRRRA